MTCDETCRTAVLVGPCTGWIETGYPWHGCHMEPDHDTGRGRPARRTHECKCGHRWVSRD